MDVEAVAYLSLLVAIGPGGEVHGGKELREAGLDQVALLRQGEAVRLADGGKARRQLGAEGEAQWLVGPGMPGGGEGDSVCAKAVVAVAGKTLLIGDSQAAALRCRRQVEPVAEVAVAVESVRCAAFAQAAVVAKVAVVVFRAAAVLGIRFDLSCTPALAAQLAVAALIVGEGGPGHLQAGQPEGEALAGGDGQGGHRPEQTGMVLGVEVQPQVHRGDFLPFGGVRGGGREEAERCQEQGQEQGEEAGHGVWRRLVPAGSGRLPSRTSNGGPLRPLRGSAAACRADAGSLRAGGWWPRARSACRSAPSRR